MKFKNRLSRALVSPVMRIGSAAILSASLLSGCITDSGEGVIEPQFAEGTVGLRAFDGCGPLLTYFKETAQAQFDANGFIGDDDHLGFGMPDGDTRELGAPDVAAAAGDPGGANGPTVSGTNVQERGVDEADVIKSDGRFVYSVNGRQLLIHSAADLTELSRVNLGYRRGEILMNGDRLAVIARAYDSRGGLLGQPEADDGAFGPKTVISVFDVSDREAPTQLSRTVVDGHPLAARLVGRDVRLAVHFQGGFDVEPEYGHGGMPRQSVVLLPEMDESGGESSEGREGAIGESEVEVEDDATDSDLEQPREAPIGHHEADPEEDWREQFNAQVRDAINASTLADWTPRLSTLAGGEITDEQVTTCAQFHRPGERSGLGVTALIRIDLDEAVANSAEPAVVTGPGVVYASATSLYLTTSSYPQFGDVDVAIAGGTTDVVVTRAEPSEAADAEPMAIEIETENEGDRQADDALVDVDPEPIPDEQRSGTQIHKIDITDGVATYRASGRVFGYPLNQFALSEYEGAIRIATTEERWALGQDRVNHLFVLQEERGPWGAQLVTSGQINDIAEGERIYAVRFMGERGFMVTFREVDPLFTMDLSDPAEPRLIGELKIPGFSTYLHPFDDEHLIGIGQSATDQGRITGMQLSLFDVSDFAAPALAHALPLGQGNSDALYDHHAFTYWAPLQTLMIPVSLWNADARRAGLRFYQVSAENGFVEDGFVDHSALSARGAQVEITRSMVINDTVLSMSRRGLQLNNLNGLQPLARVAYPDDNRDHDMDRAIDLPEPGPDPVPEPAEPAEDIPAEAD